MSQQLKFKIKGFYKKKAEFQANLIPKLRKRMASLCEQIKII